MGAIASAVLVVFAIATVWWMSTSFDDYVPLVQPDELPEGTVASDLPTTAQYHCSAPLSGDDEASGTDEASEALEVQTLSREPCERWWPQRKGLAAVNVAVALGGLIALGVRSFRPRSASE